MIFSWSIHQQSESTGNPNRCQLYLSIMKDETAIFRDFKKGYKYTYFTIG